MNKNKEKMLIRAEQKNIRITSRKVRLVAELVKKLSPQEALKNLQFINKRAAKPLARVIKQAIANAVNNFGLVKEELKFYRIEVMEGPVFKRWRPVSRGRTHSVKKRTSHIRVILESTAPKAGSRKF